VGFLETLAGVRKAHLVFGHRAREGEGEGEGGSGRVGREGGEAREGGRGGRGRGRGSRAGAPLDVVGDGVGGHAVGGVEGARHQALGDSRRALFVMSAENIGKGTGSLELGLLASEEAM